MNGGLVSKGGSIVDSVDAAIELVSQVKTLPQPIVVIGGSSGSGKTWLANFLAEQGLGTYVNLSLTLSRYMMMGSATDGPWRASDFIARLPSAAGSDLPMILDNIEAVFQPELQLNPLSWFLQMAREVPLVVIWPGVVSHGEFVYSTPNRPDYYHQRDLSVVVINIEA